MQEVRIKTPEHYYRKQSDECDAPFRIAYRESIKRSRYGKSPSFDEKRITGESTND
jgi:hypothetical protein